MTTQMSFLDALEARNTAIEAAVQHADRKHAGWSGEAYKYLLEYASVVPLFKAEDVRRFAEDKGLSAPPDPRAWGHVLQKASKAKRIERIGFGMSGNKQAHCRPTAIWRSA